MIDVKVWVSSCAVMSRVQSGKCSALLSSSMSESELALPLLPFFLSVFFCGATFFCDEVIFRGALEEDPAAGVTHDAFDRLP